MNNDLDSRTQINQLELIACIGVSEKERATPQR